MAFDYDVVIVGAGVAGGLVANELAKQDVKVIVLEAGPNEVNRQKLMKKFFVAAAKTPESPYADEKMAPRPEVLNLDGYYVQKGASKFGSTYERRVGGTSWHWLGTSIRLIPSDFKMKTNFGVGEDWPLSYDDIESWYGKAEKELGVSGSNDSDLGAPRTTPYEQGPIAQSYLDKYVAGKVQGATFAGNPVEVRATPQARDPEACLGSTSCIPLCPIGAKYEAIQHLNKAKAKGAVIQEKSVATKVIVGADGKIAGLEYTKWDGTKTTVTAKSYVLAANAIETPKLMLMSVSEAFPNGVGNSSGQVGRNLMDHPIQLSWAKSKDPLYSYRGPLSTSGIETLRDGPFRKERGAFRIEIGNEGWSWPTGGPNSTVSKIVEEQKLFGAKLRGAVKEHVQREFRLASLVEQLANPENRIRPSTELDALGVPRPEITYTIHEYEKAGLEAAKQAHTLVFEKMGAEGIQHSPEFHGAGHIMGTTKCGSNKATSVVDKDGKCHDHENLWIVGSSTFPATGTGNPTLTIAALALKTAAAIKTQLG